MFKLGPGIVFQHGRSRSISNAATTRAKSDTKRIPTR